MMIAEMREMGKRTNEKTLTIWRTTTMKNLERKTRRTKNRAEERGRVRFLHTLCARQRGKGNRKSSLTTRKDKKKTSISRKKKKKKKKKKRLNHHRLCREVQLK